MAFDGSVAEASAAEHALSHFSIVEWSAWRSRVQAQIVSHSLGLSFLLGFEAPPTLARRPLVVDAGSDVAATGAGGRGAGVGGDMTTDGGGEGALGYSRT